MIPKIEFEKSFSLDSVPISVKWSQSDECSLYITDWSGNISKYSCNQLYDASNFKKEFCQNTKTSNELILACEEIDSQELLISTSTNKLLKYNIANDTFTKIADLKSPADYLFCLDPKSKDKKFYAITSGAMYEYRHKMKSVNTVWEPNDVIHAVSYRYPYLALSLGKGDVAVTNLTKFLSADVIPVNKTGIEGIGISIEVEPISKRLIVGYNDGLVVCFKSSNKSEFQFLDKKEERISLKEDMKSIELAQLAHFYSYENQKFNFPVVSVKHFRKDDFFTAGTDGCYCFMNPQTEGLQKFNNIVKDGPITHFEINEQKSLVAIIQNDYSPDNILKQSKCLLKIFSISG